MEWSDAGANSGKHKVVSLIFEWLWWVSKMDLVTYLVHKPLKSAECMNWADFLHADCDAITFC